MTAALAQDLQAGHTLPEALERQKGRVPPFYAGLVAAFLGHAWLAGQAPEAERKHTLYLIAGLATLWVALETRRLLTTSSRSAERSNG